MVKLVRRIAIPMALVLLAACAGGGASQAQPSGAATPLAAGALSDPAYQLGSGDKLRITVFGEERLTGEYSVAGTGEVAFPLIGNVRAAGTTVQQLQESLRSKLAAGYINDPRVSVEVLNYRPYYILGEVMRPGQYPFVVGLTVQQAVATAGGYTYRANTKSVFVKRVLEPAEKQVNLRKKEIIAVQPGDTVRIGERFF